VQKQVIRGARTSSAGKAFEREACPGAHQASCPMSGRILSRCGIDTGEAIQGFSGRAQKGKAEFCRRPMPLQPHPALAGKGHPSRALRMGSIRRQWRKNSSFYSSALLSVTVDHFGLSFQPIRSGCCRMRLCCLAWTEPRSEWRAAAVPVSHICALRYTPV
jgi:hypothetical protein